MVEAWSSGGWGPTDDVEGEEDLLESGSILDPMFANSYFLGTVALFALARQTRRGRRRRRGSSSARTPPP